MGLETMLFGVSGSCDDMDATSLPVEFEPGPPSEKLTCGTRSRDQTRGRGGGGGGGGATRICLAPADISNAKKNK